MQKSLYWLGLILASVALTSKSNALEGRFTYEGLANCRKPAVTNYPIRGSGSATLKQDRSATLSYQSSNGTTTRFAGKLGGPAVEADSGSIKLNVNKRNSLRVVRDYPNNVAIVDIKFIGTTCEITMRDQLKAGKIEYTFPTAIGMSYCSRPTITKTTCVVSDR